MIENLATGPGELIWDDKKGFGFHTAPPIEYDDAYFDYYLDLDHTDMAIELTKARVDLVKQNTDFRPTDIGIGSGLFCAAMNGAGYDVNPKAVKWLKDNNCFHDVYREPILALSFWDSLEHIPDPKKLLSRVRPGGMVFVSIPIFDDYDDCLRSKHFKPGEHIWYFTKQGFIDWMVEQGYKLLEDNNRESIIGRESIHSFAFSRLSHYA